jgi:sugar lactone lactonase YvrE
MNVNITRLIRSALPLSLLVLTACSGSSSTSSSASGPTYTLGGTISGLFPGDSVILKNNAADALTVNANSAYNVNSTFTFATSIASGVAYAVTAGTPTPTSELCTVNSGTGTMGSAAVSSVSVSCSGLEMFAGDQLVSGTNIGTGTAARFFFPAGIATDSTGNIYVADYNNNAIRKITPTGVVSTFAGTAGTANGQPVVNSASGTPTFYYPWGIAIDSSDNLYVTEFANNDIRKITPTGVVTTLALTGAALNGPEGIVYYAGNLYFADSSNNAIKMVAITGGAVTTIAGSTANPGTPGNHNATGTTATFNYPVGITVDSAGNLYVADWNNNAIRKIAMPGAVVTTLAGTAGDQVAVTGHADGLGSAASFYDPEGITIDSNGNIGYASRSCQYCGWSSGVNWIYCRCFTRRFSFSIWSRYQRYFTLHHNRARRSVGNECALKKLFDLHKASTALALSFTS